MLTPGCILAYSTLRGFPLPFILFGFAPMRLTLITALLAAWCVSTGCDQPACVVCGSTRWTKFSPANERFSVLMPCKPTLSTPTVDTAAGTFGAYIYSAEPSRGYAFAVSHNSFPPEVDMRDPEALLDKICNHAVSGDVRLLYSRKVMLHGIPGRELKYEKKGQVVVNQRTYLTDREAYQVYTVMPKRAPCQTHANEFLESFDLKQR